MKKDFNSLVSELYQGLIDGSISCEKANNEVKDKQFQHAVEFYKEHQLQGKGQLSEDLMFGLLQIVNVLQYIYNNGTVEVAVNDYDYDIIYELLENGGESVVTVPVSSSRMTVQHKYPNLRGSLTKIYYLDEKQKRENPSRKYLYEWVSAREKEIQEKTGKHINLFNELVYVFPKWDGISGVFECDDETIEDVLTRGYTKTNEACSIKHILGKHDLKSHIKGKHGIKTEIMVTEEGLEKYNAKYGVDYKQTRSIASAIVNSIEEDFDKSKYLVVQELRVEDEFGNQTIAEDAFNQPYLKCKLSEINKIEEFAQSVRFVNGLRCDGAVIHIINPDVQKILGREDHKNKFEVAYKFTEEIGYSTVEDIEFTIGLFGKVTPVAKIKPIKLKGNKISSISLNSYGRFKELGLCYGDEVAIHYDIIPYLVIDDNCHSSNNKLIEPPTKCPICGSKLEESETGYSLSCKNNSCECRIKGRILNYIRTMGIEQLSEGRLCKLYELGYIKSIQDLYSLEEHVEKIANTKGFGEVMISNIIEQINSHKTQYAEVLLGSLGIEGIKDKTFEKILQEITLEELLRISNSGDVNALCSIPGIKEKKATKIIVGLNEFQDLLEFLNNTLDIIIKEKRTEPAKFTVCFTHVRDKEMEKFIEEHGGEVVSMNKKISMLIVPNNNTTGAKIDTCRELGIPIIPINDAREYILQKYN